MPDVAFISMPFGRDPKSQNNEWTKLFKYGLLPLEKPIPNLPENIHYEPIRLWRADLNLSSLNLKVNVMRGIEQSTFVICVLTTDLVRGRTTLKLTNPNVLWELGYAEAIGKPIVVMADNPSLSQLPILCGLHNICIYDHKLVKRIRPDQARKGLSFVARDLVPYVMQACSDSRKGRTGYQKTRAVAYASRSDVNLSELISHARNQVDILTTNVDYFLSDEFRVRKSKDPFVRALDRGATVRVVTMDPESVIAEYRARQLIRGQDIPGYRRELRDGIMRFFRRYRDHDHFHLHIYNDLPLQITYRVDERIITSIVTRGERARKRIQIQFNVFDQGVTESFVSHFQTMFDTSMDARGLGWILLRSEGYTEPVGSGLPTLVRKARKIYQLHQSELERDHLGEFVAVDVGTEEYALGGSEEIARAAATQKNPNGFIQVFHIGNEFQLTSETETRSKKPAGDRPSSSRSRVKKDGATRSRIYKRGGRSIISRKSARSAARRGKVLTRK